MSSRPEPEPIPMRPVDSTHLSAVGHEPKSRTLQVGFKDSSVYQYYGVPAAVAQGLTDAKSKGQFFNSEIKQKYKSSCLKPRPKKQNGQA